MAFVSRSRFSSPEKSSGAAAGCAGAALGVAVDGEGGADVVGWRATGGADEEAVPPDGAGGGAGGAVSVPGRLAATAALGAPETAGVRGGAGGTAVAAGAPWVAAGGAADPAGGSAGPCGAGAADEAAGAAPRPAVEASGAAVGASAGATVPGRPESLCGSEPTVAHPVSSR